MTSRFVEVHNGNDRHFEGDATGFSDREVRKAFIRKVYSLLAVELLFLFGAAAFGAFLKPLRTFVFFHYYTSLGIVIGCGLGGLIPYFALVCYERVRKAVPTNYIVFNIFVIMVSVSMMFVTASAEPWVFLAAFGTTLALVIFLTLISFIPCLDVTGWGLWLCAIGFVLMIFGSIAFLLYFFLHLRIMILIYAGLSVFVASLYLVFSTQLIIGGRKVELDPDEYIFGCILLFTQILTMLMGLMTLFRG